MRLLALALLVPLVALAAPPWLVVSPEGRAQPGEAFRVVVAAPEGETLPTALEARVRMDIAEVALTLEAEGPVAGGRRVYVGAMPPRAAGSVTLTLAGRESNALVLLVERRDAVQRFTGKHSMLDEPPLSENDSIYFVIGAREGWDARFQLSLKYRFFDPASGFGAGRPWLVGFYFGYTQNSLWDLSSESKPFHDTSYRPALFWKWERADQQTWISAARFGVEHESNGQEGQRSRSINVLFVRPEWRWQSAGGRQWEFTPKLYAYLSKDENPNIAEYRGHADWRLRYDSGGQWIATAAARMGTARKGSLLLDLSRRTRDMRIGPLSGYLHLQFFNGFGEDIIDYDVRRKTQLRIGVAIVP